MLASEARRQLTAQLEDARKRGMVGPGPVEAHLDHAEALAAAVSADFHGRFLDLGSRAGVPGLVLLAVWPRATGVLLDARRRRCSFLEGAVQELELADRAAVACSRAEELARDREFRGVFELVVARGFGAPATTAECAAGFLEEGGRLAVSEPCRRAGASAVVVRLGAQIRWFPVKRGSGRKGAAQRLLVRFAACSP